MIRFRRLPRAAEENRMPRTENHRRAQTTRSRPPSDLWDLDEPPPTPHNSIRLYLEEIGKIPLLTAEEETELAQRIERGDEPAKHRFIEANLRLVGFVAQKYLRPDQARPGPLSTGKP